MAGRFQRFDVTGIAKLQVRGLRNRDGALSQWDLLLFAYVPLALAALAFGFSFEVTMTTALLSGTALLVGATLSLFVFLTNLRIKASETSSLSYRRSLLRLIGSSAVGTMYTAILALLTTAALAVSGSVTGTPLAGHGLRRYGTAVLVALLAHLAVNLLTVIRRVFAIYVEVFGADFGAELHPVDTPDSKAG